MLTGDGFINRRPQKDQLDMTDWSGYICLDPSGIIGHWSRKGKRKKDQMRQNTSNSNDRPTYDSVEDFAKQIGISRQAAYAGLRRGEIPHIRLGKRFILPKTAIAEWLRNASQRSL
jgi:excisionase family DNA binding protein